MKISDSLRAALTAVIGMMWLSTGVLAETSIRAIAAWPPSLTQVREVFYAFQKEVTEASNGEIKFRNNGPEVVPPFDQFQPLSAGVFDVLYAAAVYHQTQTGVGVVVQLLENMNDVRKTDVLDHINDYYRKKFGVEILAIIRSPQNEFVLREPVQSGAGLAGRKIRSNALYDATVRELGAVPVNMSPADAYAAMQKGVLDGIAFPMHAVADFRLYEIGKYMTRPGFGTAADLVMANSKRLASLPSEQQKIIRDKALKIEREGTAFMKRLADDQNSIMEKNGVKITEFSPEVSKKVDQAFAAGLIGVARKSDPQGVDAVIEFARSKGVMRY